MGGKAGRLQLLEWVRILCDNPPNAERGLAGGSGPRGPTRHGPGPTLRRPAHGRHGRRPQPALRPARPAERPDRPGPARRRLPGLDPRQGPAAGRAPGRPRATSTPISGPRSRRWSAQHLKKHGGDAEKSLAAIPAGRSTRESLAAARRPRGRAPPSPTSARARPERRHDADPDRTATYAVGTATADGQRFRVLRPHARGGLGAVFVALDAELNREVALKQILDHHADDPTSRQRFLLEAEITGGLEHPGSCRSTAWAPTATAGRTTPCGSSAATASRRRSSAFHADATLKTDPGRRSLELRKLLRRFVDVCNAIEYAHTPGRAAPRHQAGQRDRRQARRDAGRRLGPGQADGPGRAGGRRRRADARCPSSASGSAETLPGSALGTPAYMSPEQAAGDLDRARPAARRLQPGRDALLPADRQGRRSRATSARCSARCSGASSRRRAGRPGDRPGAGGGLPQGDGARPEDRYASRRALADDVERWMADEPVSACREPWRRGWPAGSAGTKGPGLRRRRGPGDHDRGARRRRGGHHPREEGHRRGEEERRIRARGRNGHLTARRTRSTAHSTRWPTRNSTAFRGWKGCARS